MAPRSAHDARTEPLLRGLRIPKAVSSSSQRGNGTHGDRRVTLAEELSKTRGIDGDTPRRSLARSPPGKGPPHTHEHATTDGRTCGRGEDKPSREVSSLRCVCIPRLIRARAPLLDRYAFAAKVYCDRMPSTARMSRSDGSAPVLERRLRNTGLFIVK